MKILFKNPTEKIKGERKSKLLDENSELYQFIQKCRSWLISQKSYQIDCRPPHIELLKNFEKDDVQTLIKRSLVLHNQEIRYNFNRIGNALVIINTGNVEGYGETHCTIAYFPKGLDEIVYQNILKEMCLQ